MRMKWRNLLALMFLISAVSGCATLGRQWKSLISGSKKDAPAKEQSDVVTFSERPNLLPPSKRQYRRTTRQSLQEEAQLEERSGSLWTMEGQGAYLFAQNIMRMIGDPIPIGLEGDPKAQVETKVGVIKKLMERIETRQKEAAARALASEDGEAPPPAPAPPPAAEGEKPKAGDAKKKDEDEFKVATVPSRIVERTIDGNYRIKGSQSFNIGPREYRVIVTGIVRAEDFSEDGVSATKLLDPKFDVVNARGEKEQM